MAHAAMGHVLSRLNRYEEAVAALQRSLALKAPARDREPDDAHAHANKGAALYHLGRLDEARRSFERALSLKPDLPAARIGLREVRKRLGQRGQ